MALDILDNVFSITTYYETDFSRLERAIEEVFGFDEYSIPCCEECGNDVSLTFTVIPMEYKMKITRDTRLQYILNEMCYRGLIIPGEYLVNVSW